MTTTTLPAAGWSNPSHDVVTVLVVTVAGEVDEEWLAELTRRSVTASVQRLQPGEWPLDGAAQDPGPSRPVLEAGDIRLDLGRLEVTVAGRRVSLTHQELLLLEVFLRHPGRLLTRARLLELAWNQVGEGPRRTVDVHVLRLRVKLGAAARRIVTVRGFGYRFETDDAQLAAG